MKQYKELLQTIKEKGTVKPAARANMPTTTSLFGYQFRHNLQDGFPLLTTKEIDFKKVVVELLWFLRGDTNIKYLVDNGCNIWNEDAYNYYCKIASNNNDETWNKIYIPCNNSLNLRSLNLEIVDSYSMFTFEEFVEVIKNHSLQELKEQFSAHGYTLGDCGYQYGKVWRDWQNDQGKIDDFSKPFSRAHIDQIKNLITSLRNTPESRRHIVTAIDPAHDTDLALYWCHAMFQFNCRPIPAIDVYEIAGVMYDDWEVDKDVTLEQLWQMGYPKYYLDCQLYQRSADVFLGVPFNIASYALLTHILAKMCNMVAGEFIHSFGDVHIYENHMKQVDLQLGREERKLPNLYLRDCLEEVVWSEDKIDTWTPELFVLENYNPHPAIKAKLSTGLIK